MRAGMRMLAVLAGYIGVAVAWTWPVAAHLTTAIPGDGKDGWQETWDLWWFARAVGAGRNPFSTDLLFHPWGADLTFHSLMPFNGLLALPAQALGGPILAYNVAILLSLAGSAWGAYGLARDRLARVRALPGAWAEVPPLAAGLLFGFSPYMADHLLSHLNLVAAEGLPFVVWALLRAREGGGKGAWRWIVGAALALVVTALCDWQYVLFLAIWTALWLGAEYGLRLLGWLRQTPRSSLPTLRPLLGPAAAWLLFLLLVSPLVVAMLGQVGRTAAGQLRDLAGETLLYSADLLAYIIPSPFHPWWGGWAAEVLRPLPGTLIEKVMWPTLTALGLAALGWWAGRRRGWPVGGWAAMAGAFCVLSLGPTLHVGGTVVPIPLPAALLYQLPIANLTRAPGRFVVLVLLALAVLLAYGLAHLLRGSERRPTLSVARLVAGAAIVALGIELWVAPYRLATWDVAAGTATLRALPSGQAVFDVPVRAYDSAPMQAQMVHEHPIIGGYLARSPAYPLLDGVPVFSAFTTGEAAPDLCAPPLDGLGPGLFAYFTTGALVLHKDRLDNQALDAARELATRAGLGAPVLEDDRLVIYRPPAPTTPLGPWANLDVSTWYDREADSAAVGGVRRWMGQSATLRVWRPAPTAATLHLRLGSFGQSRRLVVTIDGGPGVPVLVDLAPGPLDLPLPPGSGQTIITLRAVDPPTRPVDVGAGPDQRRLSVALVGCSLELRP